MSSIVNGPPAAPNGLSGPIQPLPAGPSSQTTAAEPAAGGVEPTGGGSSLNDRVLAIMSGEEDGSSGVWAGGSGEPDTGESPTSQLSSPLAAVLAPIGSA